MEVERVEKNHSSVKSKYETDYVKEKITGGNANQ